MSQYQFREEKQLPEPFASWLNPNRPLPAGVRLLPLQTRSLAYLLPWLFVGLFFVAWPLVAVVAAVQSVFVAPAGEGWHIFYTFVGGGLMTIMFFFFSIGIFGFIWNEWQWQQAHQKGRLRHGLFLGREGLLIRTRYRPVYAIPRSAIQLVQVDDSPRHRRPAGGIKLELEGEEILFDPDTELPLTELVKIITEWQKSKSN